MKRHLKLSLTTVLALGIGALALVKAQTTPTLTAQDYADIQQLYAKYNIAIDGGDGEGYASTFVKDGEFNTFKGHDALVGFINTWRTKQKGDHFKHWNTNLQITAAPGGATGYVYLMLLDVSQKPPVIFTVAHYEDQLTKTPQGWRFVKRVTKGDAVTPAAESK
jgi:hypothetical protein